MSIRIVLNESAASKRCVPIMCFRSNGTSAATNESGRTFMFSIGGAFYGSGGSISAVSAVDGMYMCNFAASKVSVLGQGMVMYSSSTALPWMTPFEVTAEDPWTSGVTLNAGAYSNVTVRIEGVNYSGLTIQGLSNYANISNVTLAQGTHSGATVQGVSRVILVESTSTVSGMASTASVVLRPGTHSDATVQGVTRVNSSTTPANGLYSAVTVRIDPVDYSGLTIQGLSNYANIPTSVELTASSITSMAAAVVTRNIDNSGFDGRTVGSALASIRNRVVVDGNAGTITVYDTDDSTVLWSGVITTGRNPLNSVDPS